MYLTSDLISWNGLSPQPSTSDDASDYAYLHTGKTILVTRAGASIGFALAKTIHRFPARCLLLIDSSKQALCRIPSDLSGAGSHRQLPLLGSIADEPCLRHTFQRYHPEIIDHAAAFKHVSLTEMNPFAVVQNNVFATSALAMLAQRFDVARLTLISTDKALNPENTMGTFKRLAELLLLSMPARAACMGSIRLGNVFGLEGSVVLLFLEQIARGGPVTVTDPDLERYVLSREETVQRALAGAAVSCMGDGAIAIPATGAPIRIVDLARYLIEQAFAKDLEITYTGLRPGDKLQEQFVFEREAVLGSRVDGVQWIDSPGVPEAERAAGLAELNTALGDTNLSQQLAVLTRLVAEYQASSFLLQQAGVPAAQ